MRQLKIAIIFFLIIFSLFLTSCDTAININDHFDHNMPLKITKSKNENQTNSESNNLEVNIRSDIYTKLIEWGNNNTKDWRQSPASYIGEIVVTQGDFRLLSISKDNSVVIGFTNKEGKARQYIKRIKDDDLNFLIH